MQQVEPHGAPPTKRISKLSGHTRDKRGCLTCRQRKKKCDKSSSTVCAQCQRLNLRCVWEEERNVVDLSARRSSSLSPETSYGSDLVQHSNGIDSALIKAPHPMQFWMEATENEPSVAMNRRLALRYYVQTFAGILSTNAENNGFLSVLLPMAMESGPLLNTIIAWSSSHLALYRRDLAVKALEDRSAALTSFASSFSTGGMGQELALAACLILVSMESILGDTTCWYEHLLGAASIIKTTFHQRSDGRLASSLESTLEGRWLLRNFAYHDILASVTLNQAMLIPGLYWFNEAENVVDTYFGLASVPMAMLAEISTLFRCEDEDEAEQADTRDNTSVKVHRIERRLLDWKAGEARDASLVSLAESYRSAALIHLYRTLRFHHYSDASDLSDKIERQVAIIISNVTRMPNACLPECTLLFPLFLAGGEARDLSQRQFVRQRMQEIADYRHFENVGVGLSVLEEVWDVQTRTLPVDPARPYDWTCVLERRSWKLALS